jgi:uncharacterized protein
VKRWRVRLRDLLGSNDPQLQGSLRAQVDAALRGARLAREVIAGRVASDDARDRIGEIEHEGDRQRANLVDALSHSLAPPFDREDLFRLSRSIDDVLDNLRDFVREYDLFEAPEGARFEPVLAAIEEGLERLQTAIERIVDRPAGLTLGALAAKKVGNQVRQEYQLAVAALLNEGPVTTELLKCRELLRRLDVVGLRLGEAADSLADGAMKRSH